MQPSPNCQAGSLPGAPAREARSREDHAYQTVTVVAILIVLASVVWIF